MTKELFNRYADLQLQAKAIQSELDAMKPDVLAALPGKTLKLESGVTFTVANRRKWHYTAAVAELESKAKDLKKYEEAKGLATFEGTTYLTVRA